MGIIDMKKIALIGSTGSIGTQVIQTVSDNPDKFKIVALVACSSVQTFTEQLNRLTPEYAALTDETAAQKVTEVPASTTFLKGEQGALTALEECGADLAFIACSGFAGLAYSLKAANLDMPIALANKETLVCGGELVMPKAKELLPVDSEHSAIWQCLNFDRGAPFERLVITASGGPFRGRKWEELSSVTAEQALNHPTWSMGAKITIDSATLLNKGYEVIEAHHLYNAPYEKITTVIHPKSVVHSMVQFADGATIAQLSYPTMEVPIRLALTYPERIEGRLATLDFTKALTLEFSPLIRQDYPLYDLALSCGERGGVLPTALNAASEVAVGAFLKGQVGFTEIYTVADKVVQSTQFNAVESFEQLNFVDKISRERAKRVISSN
ncbi:MAG: 1-deoxy-D-xylulose-5-phosphate reductoisomerase [Candidatus Coproplasma sp.]